jgi:hypothetical protein
MRDPSRRAAPSRDSEQRGLETGSEADGEQVRVRSRAVVPTHRGWNGEIDLQ